MIGPKDERELCGGVPTESRAEVARLMRALRTTPCGRPTREADETLYSELRGIGVSITALRTLAIVLTDSAKAHREISKAAQSMTRTRRHRTPDGPDEETGRVGLTEYEYALKRWRFLTGLRDRGTRPTERAVDIAACKLCDELRRLCDEPRYGLVGQLLVCAGLMEPGRRYEDVRQSVINRVNKPGVGENWPYWTEDWD